MRLIDRAKNIIVTPKTEWDVIAAETTPPAALVTGYVLPLAAVAAIAGFIGMCFVGITMPLMGTVRIGLLWGLVSLVYTLVMAVVMVFVLGFIIDVLAPTFGAQKNLNQAIKVAAYSFTPVWIASIVKIIPILGVIVIIAAIYAIYVLYLGLPRVMKGPQEKAAGYTAVVVIVGIILSIIIGLVGGLFMSPAMMGAGYASEHAAVKYDKDSPMGRLDEFSKKMEEAGKKMEAAQKSGDPAKQMEAAAKAMSTVMSGGKAVDPVSIDQLKPLVPEKFAGMPRTDLRTERSGVTGFMVAKAEATYGDTGGKSVGLEIVDTGGAAGLMGLASWIGVQGEREDSNRREVTRKEGNRLVHEEVDKRGGHNKYTVVVAERFVISAEGGADINALKSGVASLDLAKLESMK